MDTSTKNGILSFLQHNKVKLCVTSPTPLHESKLNNSDVNLLQNSIKLYYKRDDLTGLGGSGNKIRKLEYLLYDALYNHKNITDIITCGGIQSNHCRQTAAAGTIYNLNVHLIQNENVSNRANLYFKTGNMILNNLYDAKHYRYSANTNRELKMNELANKLNAMNHRNAYIIPLGGSNAIGCLGYIQCALEIMTQIENIDHDIYVVCAASSFGTMAGLIAGFYLFNDKHTNIFVKDVDIEGVDIKQATDDVYQLVVNVLKYLNVNDDLIHKLNKLEQIQFIEGYGGNGYGLPNGDTIKTIKRVAKCDGIVLDPVYSGKAMTAILSSISNGSNIFQKNNSIIFIHTGGIHSIYAYPDEFKPVQSSKL